MWVTMYNASFFAVSAPADGTHSSKVLVYRAPSIYDVTDDYTYVLQR